MRPRRFPLTALPALLTALAVVGCSSQAAAPSGAGGGAAVQGVTDDTFTIGTTLPLSGGAATSGKGFEAGLNAAVKEINDKGGLRGRQVKLVVLDDGFEAARSVANIRRLGDQEKVYAVVSPAGSANIPGSYPYLAQKGMPLFAPVLPPDPKQDSVFLLGTSQRDQARVIVDFLAGKGIKKVAVIGQDNELGHSIRDGVKEEAASTGVEVVANETTEPNSTEVSSAVLKVREAKPDAIVLGTDNTQSALIMKAVDELGWKPAIMGTSSTVTTGSAGTVGPAGSAAKGVYGTFISELPTSDAPEAAAWRTAQQAAAPDQVGSAYALQAYANTKIFFEIVTRMGDDLSWADFQKTAESLKEHASGIYPPITFGPAAAGGHVGTTGAKVAEWDGSDWKPVSKDWLEPGTSVS
ncbi:ABC transporter substrate-binding protein [Microtetraspora sp. AC03309]|uniref:ABC transporter substrate-binding protein n=1 Tax=Microtetraspora sp. AC03309 TaxID=2779376 RepID=UPI001E45E898|nr:ABC transporter substrate-binding protein [Microtetraspora sp. AC03309]MCC5575292.1 ABC transporter substrate-binding protein [Microtetraspora sp. AC03309]